MKRRALPASSMVDMTVSSLTVDPITRTPTLILEDKRGESLRIWIGALEASAIASVLEQITLDRPMTHDLLRDIIGECGMRVERVQINELRDNAFYSTIHLVAPGRRARTVEARPSDAIALAVRTGARICVAKKVLEHGREMNLPIGAPFGANPLLELLESLSDEEFGKWKM